MKPSRLFLSLSVLIALLIATTHLAFAWPDEPPTRAFIAGPGLNGEIEITDSLILEALKLGVTEDFEFGPLDTPIVPGEGYRITRYFEEGSFNFATLHYYPSSENRGYLFFEDGDDLIGDHTAYNEQWYYATPLGDAALQTLLKNLGVESTDATRQSKTEHAASLAGLYNRFSGWLTTLWRDVASS